MELLELEDDTYIPTTDLDGNISWGFIKNVTRHDPGKELYKVITESGRDVIVTESHSLLIWNGTKYERKSTPNVKIGDYLPITIDLPNIPNTLNEIEINNKKYVLNKISGRNFADYLVKNKSDSDLDILTNYKKDFNEKIIFSNVYFIQSFIILLILRQINKKNIFLFNHSLYC